MNLSGQQLDKDARDKDSGVHKIVNAAALKKRNERLAREAKEKKAKAKKGRR